MKRPNLNPNPTRRGAALLIIIGLLALLLIAAVAFSVMMTVERNAAANYRHAVQARQLLYAGLAKAIADIDASVGDNVYPPWTNGTRQIGVLWTNGMGQVFGRSVTCREDVLASCDTTVSMIDPAALCTTKVLSREALSYIPRALRQAVETATPECLAFNAAGDTIGRYAYVVANVSGLLDANVVGRTNRWCGASAGEIALSNDCPFDVIDSVAFTNERRTIDFRYESLEELARLNTGVDPDKLSNFETFSYALPELNPEGLPKVYLGYDPAVNGTLTNQLASRHDAITNAFAKCGVMNAMPDFPTKGAEWAYQTLIDYIDADSTLEGATEYERLARPSSENVPQIQNIALYTKYTRTGSSGTYTHIVTNDLRIRCSYPYVGTNTTTFTIDGEIYCSNMQGLGTNWASLLPLGPSGGTNTGSAALSFSANPIQNPQPRELMIRLPEQRVSSTNTSLPRIKFYARARVRISDAAGNIVDQVPAGSNVWLSSFGSSDRGEVTLRIDHTFGLSQPDLASDITGAGELSAAWGEAIDPLINWTGRVPNNQWMYSEDYNTGTGSSSLTNLNQVFSIFAPYSTSNFFNITSYGTLDTKSAYMSSGCRNNTCGGLFIDYLMTHGEALDWWNTTNTPAGRQIIPDGAIVGGNVQYWDYPTAWKRHYIKNASLESVGELGYLTIGRWQTINLYRHNHVTSNLVDNPLPAEGFHRVLDYFTLRPTNNIIRGLVNANTRNAGVRAAVFNNMPLNEWKGSTTATRLSAPCADEFGTWLGAQCGSTTNLSTLGNFWTGVSDLGQSDGTVVSATSRTRVIRSLSAELNTWYGEFEREAVIRNAADLYTTRQQIYTIIVRADAMTFEYGGGSARVGNMLNNGSILGSARAVFQVWRDPVPDANGHHPCFVRLCKILSL
jgi:hypothetical protein